MKFNVPDMSCNHCVGTIEKAVKSVDPAATVQADLGAATVTVATSADEKTVVEAMRAAGYDTTRHTA